MKVIVTAVGSSGDVFPAIAIAEAMQRRGHDALLITNPHFAPAAESAGVRLVPVGTEAEYLRGVGDPALWHPTRGFSAIVGYVMGHMPEVHATLMRHVEPGRTVVAAHVMDFASRIAQEADGVPVVTWTLSPSLFRSLHAVPTMQGTQDFTSWPRWFKRFFWWVADRQYIDPPLLPRLNELRRDHGLGPIQRPFASWIFSPLRTVGMFPDWFAPPQPDWPPQLRLTGFPLYDRAEPVPPEVDAFLGAGSPPIVFTPGSAVGDAGPFLAAAVDACRRLGRRGLLLTRFARPPGDLPADVLHAPFAPFSQVLPRAAALVHHGGIGSTAAAIAAGIPQVVMPMSHDQPDNAARVTRMGIGDRLLPAQFTGPRLADKLARLLDSPDVRSRCLAYAARCREVDGRERTCDEIEAVLPVAAVAR